jgi:hypothetical protein
VATPTAMFANSVVKLIAFCYITAWPSAQQTAHKQTNITALTFVY